MLPIRGVAPRARRSSVVASLVALCLCAACSAGAEGGRASADETESETAIAAPAGDYLPLAPGRKWTLRSRTMEKPVVLEVSEMNKDRSRLKFDNPWLASELDLRSADGKHYVTALTIAGQTAQMPDDTLYFDLGARRGAKWSNQIGTMEVVARDKTVNAGGRTYTNCVQIRETNKEGNKLLWTFAPGVGFVQFGEDSWGFFLDPAASNLDAKGNAVAPSGGRAAATAAPPAAGRSSGKVLVGLAANPTPGEGFNPRSVASRFKQSVAAGVTFIYFAPKWNEIEPSPGGYNFKDLGFHIDEANEANIPLVLNIRAIDTNQRSMPADLTNLAFDDPKVRDRLANLVAAIAPRLKGRTTHVMIGNEVNSYFDSRRGEVGAYLTLYRAGADKLKGLLPGAQTSVNFTYDALPALGSYLKPLADASDFLSLTYYPANPDFTFRDPGVVDAEFRRMIDAAGGKGLLLQEVGYASSELNGSSEEKQARFVAEIFENARLYRDRLIGVNFLFMSDLSDDTVEGFAKYYKLPNADRFKAFLKTLGMFDDGGRAKQSWKVFQEQARSVG